MNHIFRHRLAVRWCVALAGAVFLAFRAEAAIEQTLDVLQIGTHTYRNVTVTTKSKNYVFILHSAGMTNLKVAELPPDVLTKLGYADPAAPKVETNGASAWAKHTLAKLDVPQLHNVRTEIAQQWKDKGVAAKLPFPVPDITPNFLLALALAVAALYLFHCFCWKLICKKAGHEPGPMIWLPILQVFPMLRAAEMSPWWFLGFLVPGVNLVGSVIFALKIAYNRGKAPIVGVLLLLPVISIFAFLYLAFSSGGSSDEPAAPRRVEIMTLETA